MPVGAIESAARSYVKTLVNLAAWYDGRYDRPKMEKRETDDGRIGNVHMDDCLESRLAGITLRRRERLAVL